MTRHTAGRTPGAASDDPPTMEALDPVTVREHEAPHPPHPRPLAAEDRDRLVLEYTGERPNRALVQLDLYGSSSVPDGQLPSFQDVRCELWAPCGDVMGEVYGWAAAWGCHDCPNAQEAWPGELLQPLYQAPERVLHRADLRHPCPGESPHCKGTKWHTARFCRACASYYSHVSVTCANCGTSFRVGAYEAKAGRRYCGVRCRSLARATDPSQPGEHAHG